MFLRCALTRVRCDLYDELGGAGLWLRASLRSSVLRYIGPNLEPHKAVYIDRYPQAGLPAALGCLGQPFQGRYFGGLSHEKTG